MFLHFFFDILIRSAIFYYREKLREKKVKLRFVKTILASTMFIGSTNYIDKAHLVAIYCRYKRVIIVFWICRSVWFDRSNQTECSRSLINTSSAQAFSANRNTRLSRFPDHVWSGTSRWQKIWILEEKEKERKTEKVHILAT